MEDIQLGNVPVADEMGEPFFGIKNNLYFPDHRLYVINTDNFTFFCLCEAAKRGDIELDASIFTYDAHEDTMPVETGMVPWVKGNLQDYAKETVRLTSLQQLQAALKLGLVSAGGVHLMSPHSLTPGENEGNLAFLGSTPVLGKWYHHPHFPAALFDSIPRKKVVAHVDIDFHTDDYGEILNRAMEHPETADPRQFAASLFAGVEKVDPQRFEAFKFHVKQTGFFKKAGLRIICVSPNIVHREDVLWLTKAHVQLAMEETG